MLKVRLCLALMVVGAPAAAARTVLFPLVPLEDEARVARTVSHLVAEEMAERTELVPRSELEAVAGPDVRCADSRCASDLGAAVGAREAVIGSVARLGAKWVVRLRRVDVESGATLWTDEMSAVREEDLDAVAARLAAACIAGDDAAGRVDVTSITEEELDEPRRRRSSWQWGVLAGYTFPAGESYAGVGRLIDVAFASRFQTTDYFLESTALSGILVGSNGDADEHAGASAFQWRLVDVYGARFLSRGDVAPYFGGGVGLHYINLDGVDDEPRTGSSSASTTGLTLSGGVGLVFLRTYDVNLVLDARYRVFLDELVGGHGAHGVSFSFGILKRR